MLDEPYVRQAELMLRCLPEVSRQECFALKGGTAINLFVRPLPRLSVDIDLTYLPLSPRDEALDEIGGALQSMAGDIERHVPGARTTLRSAQNAVTGMGVAADDAQIKIEANLVLRGALFPPVERELCKAATEFFEMSVIVQSLSTEDLYGGKIPLPSTGNTPATCMMFT